ncbi:MAG: DUF3800 domain-containing protein [Clostridia bacterium]|nr:DUF3800 domain-containing protein [Clostridia bacterium]
MKIYVYIDESGSIHKNSKTRYFAVGGYFSYEDDKMKIKAKYKKENLELKKKKKLDLDTEIKSYDMTEEEKIKIFNKIQDIGTFHGCVKVFDKKYMKKEIIDSNIFFNYAVKVLIQDCILPELNLQENDEPIEFIISIDNRNIRVGELNNLETYLKTEFCIYDDNFEITYYDSKTNYGIQLADLTVNTFYNFYKNIKLVENVIKELKPKNFRVSLFPKNFRNKKLNSE